MPVCVARATDHPFRTIVLGVMEPGDASHLARPSLKRDWDPGIETMTVEMRRP